MLTHISPIEENVSGTKEGASSMDPNRVVENLSDSLQLCEPFCLTDIDSSKSLVAPDISKTDVLVGAFDSIRIAEPSEHRDNERKDNARLDDISETQSPDILSRRQSSRMINSKQKAEIEKAVRNCRATANKKPLVDLVLLKAKRKTRSSFSIRSRSSAWGWGNFAQAFEQNPGIDVSQVEHKKSRKSRGSRGLGKRNKSQISQSSKKLNGESTASTSRIRLKVKLGKQVVPSCASDIDNSIDKYNQTRLEFPNLTKDIGGRLEDEVPTRTEFKCYHGNPDKNIMLSDTSSLDVQAADKYITEKMTGNSHLCEEVEGFGVTVDNRCLDPGTSPDSEIINQIPEAPGKVPEDLHDVLISSQVYVGNGDFTGMNMPQPSSKKAVKKNTICRADNSELIDSASFFEQEEKMGDGSYSSEASISNITGSASGNTCSSEGVSMEAMPSSAVPEFGASVDILKSESAADVDLCSGSGVGVDSPESRVSEKLIPCTIPKGRKLPKCSTSRRQKGNQAKLVNKHKIEEKADGDQMVCKVESYTKTGNCALDDCTETKTGCRSTTPETSNLDMVPSKLENQYVSQRNAWVRCDDCHKWRRIAAVLADSIEETNCKWICKDSMDKDFADCLIPQEKSNSEINAELEISDASGEEDTCNARLNSNQLGQKQSKVPQNSSWKLIRSNIFLHRNRKAQTIDEIMVCHCKAPLNGRMGCGDGCLNRMLNIECVKGTCPCGELCSNQQFQKRKYAKLESFRCGKKGHGLRLLEDIPKGRFLIEYVGEVLGTNAYEARQKEYALKGHKHFYFMTLNGSEVIDACAKGNLGRFINHSCEPNCRTEKWMVNGEVCVGLFAMRDIKKGEEVTFDYNYVRVFGAAAKKCVCGSSQCRGYIGGDPDNAELIVQGDSDEEYPEPLMVCEEVDNNKNKVDKPTTAVQHLEITKEAPTPEILLEHKGQSDDSTTTVENMEINTTENEDSKKGSISIASQMGNTFEMEGSVGLVPSSVQQIETSLSPDDGKSEITSVSSCTVQRLENCSLTKSLSDTIDIKKSSKPDREIQRCIVKKPHPRTKTSRSSSSVKKGKSKNNAVNVNKPPEMDSKSNVAVPYMSKKLFEGSSNSDFEAVQVKLNELLDADGGISRRKDASRGYLKLLFLTAASGDSGNGEAIQSTRDLSMILDAILKTKSRSVLVDVINKNGLQMLHNIMKRYRREFKKIPVLRKLLKILEFLANREILTLEHISRAPPCAGVESFRESILTLTEHPDKQVHQIARKFRDTFIPRSMRKHNVMERETGRMDFHHPSSNSSRFSAPHNRSSDQSERPKEVIESVKQGTADTLENSSTSCSSSVTNAPKTRKRKSRWDQPAETKEPRIIQPVTLSNSYSSSEPVTEVRNLPGDALNSGSAMDEDAPPGFSPPVSSHITPSNNSTSTDAGPTNCPPEVVMGEPQESLISDLPISYGAPLSAGEPQERFISRLPVSYGIPLSVVQQFGTPHGEILGSWAVAPGIPFQPFPPLPPYPREKGDPPAENSMGTYHSDPIPPSTSGASPADFETQGPGGNNQHNFQRARGAPLGRKYFRQQKWNNNSKFPPPWVRNRIGGTGFMGNNSRNGFCNVGIGGGENQQHLHAPPYNSSGEGFIGMEGSENCFYPPPPPPPPPMLPPPPFHHQQNWHY